MTRFITFLSLCGGAGSTTLAMTAASKLINEGKNVSLVIQDKDKFNFLKKLDVPYEISFLDKELYFSPDLNVMIFVLTSPNQKINEMANKTNGKNIVVSDTTPKGLKSLETFKDGIGKTFEHVVVLNKLLSNRKTHEKSMSLNDVFLIKNRMVYENVIEGRNLFEKEDKISSLIKEEIKNIV
jgi:CO dehydrogenase nickel-insertion accessory protein CooC1